MKPRNMRKNNEKTCLVSLTFPAAFINLSERHFFQKMILHILSRMPIFIFFALINFREWSYFEKFAHINFREFGKFATKDNERESFCARKFLRAKVSVLKVKEINHYILNGFTYRKSFPGVSAKDLTHHCLPTLQEDKPDSCIINVGSNDVGRMQPDNIAKHILKTVKICHQYEVNDVYV